MKYLVTYPHIGILILSWFLTDLLVPVIRALASRGKVLDIPSDRKVHVEPVPRLGGIAVYIAFSLSLLLTLEFHPTLLLILGGGGVIVLTGVLDDIRGVPAIVKLAVLVGVTELLARYGLVLNLFPALPLFNELITIFWVVFIVSSFNAIDNMNGLSVGITFIAAMFIFVVAWIEWQRWLSFVAMALAGNAIGFLRYNFPKATIFLGDSGSFFLGFVLAEVALIGEWSSNPVKGIIIPSLILGFPIFDLFITTFFRYKSGTVRSLLDAISMSAKDHCSHRLVALGYSQLTSVIILWGVAIAFGISGFMIKWVPLYAGIIVCAAVLFLLFIFIKYLAKAEKLL